MNVPKIHMIVSGDWLQVYFDGVNVYETHNISGDEMLDLLGIKYEYEQVSDDVMTQIESSRGSKRRTLHDVKLMIDMITGNERFDPDDY